MSLLAAKSRKSDLHPLDNWLNKAHLNKQRPTAASSKHFTVSLSLPPPTSPPALSLSLSGYSLNLASLLNLFVFSVFVQP